MSSSTPTGNPAEQAADPAPAAPWSRAWTRDCAVLIKNSVVASSPSFGSELSKIKARLVSARSAYKTAWLGLLIEIPFSDSNQSHNEDRGFGVRYFHNPAFQEHSAIHEQTLIPGHRIEIRFPRDQYILSVVAADDIIRGYFPTYSKTNMAVATVRIEDGATATIAGYGIPYLNAEDAELDGIVNDNKPIVDGITLLDLLDQKEFTIAVAADVGGVSRLKSALPPPLSSPSDENHECTSEAGAISSTSCEAYGIQSVIEAKRLHLALMSGNGFHDWLATNHVALESKIFKRLPTLNYLDIKDQAFVNALLEETLPNDRDRLRRYISNRPLGLGLMTGGPGFGKTTALAVVALAMHARLGRILGAGPSNAVDNLASRIYETGATVTTRYNVRKGDDNRRRRPLVIRGYNLRQDLNAFKSLVINNDGKSDAATPRLMCGGLSEWRLEYSLAYWTLVLFRSALVPDLHADDKKALHAIRHQIDHRADLAPLRDFVATRISWKEFSRSAPLMQKKFEALMHEVLREVDILCVTPAQVEKEDLFKVFRNESAMGIVVDEAANMNRGDLVGVWGNTLLPCFLAGDPRQLPPTLNTKDEPDMSSFFDRQPRDGKFSPLEFLQSGGMPVYRLRTQMRMAKGLFDIVAKIIPPEVPLTYGPGCDISLARFEVGRLLEAFAQERFPVLKPAEGTLSPLFIHCDGGYVIEDKATGSRESPDQVKAALGFAVDFVKAKGVKSSSITVLSPYKANLDHVEEVRKSAEFSEILKDMPRASTVDGYQGQENDIIIVVMCTNEFKGPGITADKQRLNVLLTRARCGMVIVGDIHSAGRVTAIGKKAEKAAAKGRKKLDRIRMEMPTGERRSINASELQMLHKSLWDAGRVATVVFEKRKKAEEKVE